MVEDAQMTEVAASDQLVSPVFPAGSASLRFLVWLQSKDETSPNQNQQVTTETGAETSNIRHFLIHIQKNQHHLLVLIS